MEEYSGLLLSVTEGIKFPKKKIYLFVRYSRYQITFPVVHGGDTTIFNQGYVFRNIKVEGHDERNLPVLIQAYEKKTLYTNKLIASLRVEAFNFYDYDFYEPTYFCLTPVEEYKSYECQLKVVFQLVKPSSIFVYPKNVDVTSVQPIAYQIEVQNANLNQELVDKKLYFSCRLNINSSAYVKTKDDKGIAPQWGVRQIISTWDFANTNELSFTVFSVTHPHQPKSSAVVGVASVTFKRVLSTTQPQFELPILKKKQEVGMLNVVIRPVYPQSRDGTANPERIYSLQPNISTFGSVLDSSIQQTPSSVTLLRVPTVHSPMSDPSVTSRTMQTAEQTVQESIQDQVLGVLSTQYSMRDGLSASTVPNKVSLATELKKVVVSTPVIEEERVDLSNVYVSKCTAIIRKSDSTRVQGLRLINRAKNEYIESLSYVL